LAPPASRAAAALIAIVAPVFARVLPLLLGLRLWRGLGRGLGLGLDRRQRGRLLDGRLRLRLLGRLALLADQLNEAQGALFEQALDVGVDLVGQLAHLGHEQVGALARALTGAALHRSLNLVEALHEDVRRFPGYVAVVPSAADEQRSGRKREQEDSPDHYQLRLRLRHRVLTNGECSGRLGLAKAIADGH
jgi:hypothetical protein